ncbi:MAG: hypothetical protein U0796_22145 [Gemmatales bacterium]
MSGPLPGIDVPAQVYYIVQSTCRYLHGWKFAADPQVIDSARGYAQQPGRLSAIY